MNILEIILWSIVSAIYTNFWWMACSIENVATYKIGIFGVVFGSLVILIKIFHSTAENNCYPDTVMKAAPFLRFLIVSLISAFYTSAWWMAFTIEAKKGMILGRIISFFGTMILVLMVGWFLLKNWEKIWELE